MDQEGLKWGEEARSCVLDEKHQLYSSKTKHLFIVKLAQEPARLHGAKMSNPEQYLKSGMMFRGFDQDRELISVAENQTRRCTQCELSSGTEINQPLTIGDRPHLKGSVFVCQLSSKTGEDNNHEHILLYLCFVFW